MQIEDYNSFCASLPHTTHVVQWGGAHVWKVGGKVFAIAGWGKGDDLGITFKCSDITYEILKDEPGLRPAPYLASRGMKWLQRYGCEIVDDAALERYLEESYRLVARGLTKRVRKELGLDET